MDTCTTTVIPARYRKGEMVMKAFEPAHVMLDVPPEKWSPSDAMAVWSFVQDVVCDAANAKHEAHDDAYSFLANLNVKTLPQEAVVLLKLALDEMPSARNAMSDEQLADIDCVKPLEHPLICTDHPLGVSTAYSKMNVVL